jgi:hypothetical protein
MELSRRHVIVLPSVLVGSYDKMRLNFNVFFDPASFASFGTSESFVLIRFPITDNADAAAAPSTTTSLIARAIPLPALNNLCSSRALQASTCIGIDEDSLPIMSHINADVEIMPIPRYMLSPWQTLVFQSIEDTDEFFLPSPLACSFSTFADLFCLAVINFSCFELFQNSERAVEKASIWSMQSDTHVFAHEKQDIATVQCIWYSQPVAFAGPR